MIIIMTDHRLVEARGQVILLLHSTGPCKMGEYRAAWWFFVRARRALKSNGAALLSKTREEEAGAMTTNPSGDTL